MVATHSTMLPLGSRAPGFQLPDTEGKPVSLSDFAAAPALLVAFICNHCPYVKHIRGGLAQLARDYRPLGVAIVGINANDAESYPADSPAMMAVEAKPPGICSPISTTSRRRVAKAYRAACTPDFFLFDAEKRLVYRGQMDDSRPGNNTPVTGKDLRAALDAVLAGKPPRATQKASLGCNIKWRPGNEPDYFG